MESFSKNDYFKVIEDEIKDHNIVTVKWLSRKLNIHNTIAKSLMKEFLDNTKDKNKFIVTWVLYGKKSTGDLLLHLVKESELPNFKDGSISVIDEQIYSIQPANSIFKPEMIYNLDKATFELKQLSLSSIKFNKEVICKAKDVRPDSFHKTVEPQKPAPITKPMASPKKQESLKSNPSPKKDQLKADDLKPVRESSKSESKKSSVKPPVNSKGSISTFFQKQAAKGSVKKLENDSSKDNPVNGTQKQIKVEDPPKMEISPEKEIPHLKSSKNVLVTDNLSEKIEQKKSKKVQETEKPKAKKSKSKKPVQKNKKMKRIIMPSDSSSNSEASDDESHISEPDFDDIPEPKVELESPKKERDSPAVIVSQGKKRKRKVIEKTVMDDEGYLHTNKEVVYESCSSDENDERIQNDENLDNNKRLKTENVDVESKSLKEEVVKNQKQKTKQSSLMSFFRKPQKT